jgi:hypothetical protein
MATPVQNPVKPLVICVDPLEGRNSWHDTLRAVPAWIISAGIHALLLFLFWLLIGDPRALAHGEDSTAAESVSTIIEAVEPKEILVSEEHIGVEPGTPPGFDVPRQDDMIAPGPVSPESVVGAIGPTDTPPPVIPAPPGSGGGPGGAPEVPGLHGIGLPQAEKGGMNGVVLIPGGRWHASGATKERIALAEGGSKLSEAAVARGLKWLALHQAPAGHWSLDQYHLHARQDLNSNRFFNDGSTGRGGKYDTAGAAFGLLPFLAAGITHKASGRAQDDQYVKTVGRALNYLLLKQGKDGAFPGSMYEHGLATITICEAYSLTADPMLKPHAQAALNYIIKAQDPTSGGWRYSPRQGGDTSVVGWQVMALKSGQMSGLSVPNLTLKLAEKWLDSCETTDGGGFGYTGPSDAPTMTAVGLLCREYLGTPRRNPNLQNGIKKLQRNAPPHAQKNIYYEYYATQVFHHMGGGAWDDWNRGTTGKNGMRDILIERQDRDGSWNPQGDAHAGAGGRIMQTSLSLLTLEVYYRHLPLYQRIDTKK